MRKKSPVPFTQKFPNADPSALRLLQRLLAFDPKDRPTATEVPCFFPFSSCSYLSSSCGDVNIVMLFDRRWLILTLRALLRLKENLLVSKSRRWNLNLNEEG